MEGCLTSFRREISRIAVDGTPSDSLMYRNVKFKSKIYTEVLRSIKADSHFSRRIFFKATIFPVSVSTALNTTPYVPLGKTLINFLLTM